MLRLGYIRVTMNDNANRSIRLPQKMVERIKKEVESGNYTHISEFVRDAVREKLLTIHV